jgi:hypothetical protein
MSDFVEECRHEWERLGLAPLVIDDLTAQLEGELEAADTGDAIPGEIRGYSTYDARAFAAAFARARPVRRPRLQYTASGNRPGLKTGVLVLLVLFAIGAVAAVLEFRSPSEQESGPTQTQTAVDLVTVPDLLGLSTSAATKAAQSAGVRIGDTTRAASPGTASGTVLHESPDAGARLPRGSTLTLVLAK